MYNVRWNELLMTVKFKVLRCSYQLAFVVLRSLYTTNFQNQWLSLPSCCNFPSILLYLDELDLKAAFTEVKFRPRTNTLFMYFFLLLSWCTNSMFLKKVIFIVVISSLAVPLWFQNQNPLSINSFKCLQSIYTLIMTDFRVVV